MPIYLSVALLTSVPLSQQRSEVLRASAYLDTATDAKGNLMVQVNLSCLWRILKNVQATDAQGSRAIESKLASLVTASRSKHRQPWRMMNYSLRSYPDLRIHSSDFYRGGAESFAQPDLAPGFLDHASS